MSPRVSCAARAQPIFGFGGRQLLAVGVFCSIYWRRRGCSGGRSRFQLADGKHVEMMTTETIVSGLPKFVAPLNLAQLSPLFIQTACFRYYDARIGRNVCFWQNIPELVSWGGFLLGDRTAFILPSVARSAPAGLEGVLRPTNTRPFRFPGCRWTSVCVSVREIRRRV